MERETHAVYVISVAAEIAGVHPQTLRIYERRGLLQPARTSGGNRRYSNADIRRLQRIAELANAGMNLEGIRQVLELESEVVRLQREVEQLRTELNSVVRHRRESNELVPLHQAITLFGRTPSIFRDKR
jgi:MerR family transcriptional regulator/heat shock protein HspR